MSKINQILYKKVEHNPYSVPENPSTFKDNKITGINDNKTSDNLFKNNVATEEMDVGSNNNTFKNVSLKVEGEYKFPFVLGNGITPFGGTIEIKDYDVSIDYDGVFINAAGDINYTRDGKIVAIKRKDGVWEIPNAKGKRTMWYYPDGDYAIEITGFGGGLPLGIRYRDGKPFQIVDEHGNYIEGSYRDPNTGQYVFNYKGYTYIFSPDDLTFTVGTTVFKVSEYSGDIVREETISSSGEKEVIEYMPDGGSIKTIFDRSGNKVKTVIEEVIADVPEGAFWKRKITEIDGNGNTIKVTEETCLDGAAGPYVITDTYDADGNLISHDLKN